MCVCGGEGSFIHWFPDERGPPYHQTFTAMGVKRLWGRRVLFQEQADSPGTSLAHKSSESSGSCLHVKCLKGN